MDQKSNITLLIDFDGVIRLDSGIAGDTGLFFDFLEKNDIPSFIISNSTQYTGGDIKEILKSSGIKSEINAMTTIDAAVNYLASEGLSISLYCKENVRKYFNDFITEKQPDAVVIGDIEDGWNYAVLNEIFRKVLNGAQIIALQKNKFWRPEGKEVSLDAGAFITAIEFAASREAFLIGKPSPVYFNTALQKLGFKAGSEFYMIGDDVTTDIKGAKDLGGKGILVFTGKTKKNYDRNNSPEPDFECDSLKDIITVLKAVIQNTPLK